MPKIYTEASNQPVYYPGMETDKREAKLDTRNDQTVERILKARYLILRVLESGEVALQPCESVRDLETQSEDGPTFSQPVIHLRRYVQLP